MAKVERKIRGIDDSRTLDDNKLLRDVRPFIVQILDPFREKYLTATFLAIYGAIVFVVPATANLMLIFAIVHFLFCKSQYKDDRLPMRLPFSADSVDYSDPIPGRKKFFKADGTLFLGNEMKTGKELWASMRDALTHLLVFGTTGSGKTEILLGFLFGGALASSGGANYVDPKASPKLPMQIYTMCRICGRDDDFRVLNYQSESKRTDDKQLKRSSNTNNPFKFGSAESLTQLLVSLIPKSEGDNAIFGQNAQTLITALMYGLVELRDKFGHELNINVVRKHMSATEYVKLAIRDDISKPTKDALHSFLASVGFQPSKVNKENIEKGDVLAGQPRSFPEQFGYARSYFSLSLASLTDTYGNIYNTEYGEVDMYDVIMSRRICVTLLPSMSKSEQELQNLGKISLSALRNACSAGLGDGRIEGLVEDILNALPTDSKSMFMAITDEYESVPTPGFSTLFTQGRGLGIVGICGTQSYGGLKGSDEKGAQQLVENTKIKAVSTVESGEGTWELVDKLVGGETKVLQTDGYGQQIRGQHDEHGASYRDQGQAKVATAKRVKLQDLQNQIEGEFHIFFRGTIVRGESFYTDVPLDSHRSLRIAHQLKVASPVKEEFEQLFKLADRFDQLTTTPPEVKCVNRDYEQIVRFFEPAMGINEELCVATISLLDWKPDDAPPENQVKPDIYSTSYVNDDMAIEEDDEYQDNDVPDYGLGDDEYGSDTIKALASADSNDSQEPSIDDLTAWMNLDFTPDLINIEKQLGASSEEAISATGDVILGTAETSITHPPEPPVPPVEKYESLKDELIELIEINFSAK